jgi:hypothetical protein
MRAVFRTCINGEAPPSGRTTTPWAGYADDPSRPSLLSLSSEIRSLDLRRLPGEYQGFIPERWNAGAKENKNVLRMITWTATSCQIIDRRPSNPSGLQSKAFELLNKALKEACGNGKNIAVLVRDGAYITNRIHQLASTPVPAPATYWPWMDGHFWFDPEKGLISPLLFDGIRFDSTFRTWIHQAFVNPDKKDVHNNGIKAHEIKPVSFFDGYQQDFFIDARQYYASQAISKLYEAKAEQENKETWANGQHKRLVIPGIQGSRGNSNARYVVLLNIRIPESSDTGLVQNSSAALPEVGERVEIKLSVEQDVGEEHW